MITLFASRVTWIWKSSHAYQGHGKSRSGLWGWRRQTVLGNSPEVETLPDVADKTLIEA
jgi:hypothetical protein